MPFSRRAVLGVGLAGTALVLSGIPVVAQEDSLILPTTPLANKVSELAEQVLPPHLRNHSVRGYLFGQAIAAKSGLRPGADYDEELMYWICMLHDIGLADIANGEQRFEIDGADYAAKFLEDNGITDSRVDTVWEGIAAHTMGFSDSPVFRRRRAPEIRIAVEGIGLDVGGSPADLPPGYADLVHHTYPRFGGTRALTDSIEAQALTDPIHKAPPASLAGEIMRLRHPDVPRLTWDMVLESNGWRD